MLADLEHGTAFMRRRGVYFEHSICRGTTASPFHQTHTDSARRDVKQRRSRAASLRVPTNLPEPPRGLDVLRRRAKLKRAAKLRREHRRGHAPKGALNALEQTQPHGHRASQQLRVTHVRRLCLISRARRGRCGLNGCCRPLDVAARAARAAHANQLEVEVNLVNEQ
eukprot:6197315-Pleurochrysis_carterae.AAC.3